MANSFFTKINSIIILKFGQFKFNPQLKKIKELIQKEDFSNALDLIDKLEKEKNISEKNLVKTQLLKSRLTIDMSDFEKGLELANNLLETSKKIDVSLYIETMTIKAMALFELGKFDESLAVINEAENLIEGVPENTRNRLKSSIALIKGRNFQRKGEKDLALDNLNRTLSSSNDLNEIAIANNGIGIICASKGEFDNALDHFMKSLNAYEEIERIQPTIRILNNIGLVYSYKGDQDLSLEYYQKSLELSEKFKNKQLSATLTYNIGLIYRNRGELDLSLDYNQRSLEVYEDLGCEYESAQCYNNNGNIHHEKGNLAQALDYYNKSLEIFQKLGSKPDVAMSLMNIANVYQLQGNPDEASSYYRQSLEIFEGLGVNYDTSMTLQNLVTLLTSHGSTEEATHYLEKLRIISEKETENKAITQAYRLSKAYLLKTSERVAKRAEAQQLLQQIAEEEIVQHEYTVSALMNLCDLLLQELRTSGDEEVLNEIKQIIQRLLTIAESQKMPRLLTNAYRLQSKMALLELDLNTARKSLDQAQQIASEKGLENIAIVISGEYDKLLVQLGKWTDLIDQNVSVMERLDLTELEGMVSQIIRQEEEIPKFVEEEPALLLILSKSGVQYSKQLTTDRILDDQVIGDLITAINSFVQETFSTTGSIERIKHKEHTCVLMPIPPIESALLCCYVFKGQSYSALQKLEKFISEAEGKSSVLQILSELSKEKPVAEKNPLENLISKVFISA